jgi:outer membrane protein OmpA-like peptidoglycan-associated protein
MKKIQFCFVIVAIALFSCQTGLAKEKLTAQDWLQKGIELEKHDVHEEAIKMYTLAIKADKYYAEAYFRRAKAYVATHKSNAMEALADFDAAIDLDPTNAEAYYERGLVHSFILNNEHARDDMRTAAKLGHQGAQKWLAPATKESASMKAAAVASSEEAPKSSATGEEGTGGERGAKSLTLAEYLTSKGEPVIYFDFNMSTIKEQYQAILDEIAQVLQEKIPEANMILAGHTDSTGTEEYNDRLSLQRAKAVESYLTVKHGIPSARLNVRGYGKSAPIATNETEEGRAKNRRVELLIAPK